MAEITNSNEAYKKMIEIISEHEPSIREKKQTCQFYEGKEGKHCRATTHKTCYNCKMFSPSFNEKLILLVNYIMRQEKKATSYKAIIMNKGREIRLLKEELEIYKSIVEGKDKDEGEDGGESQED